MYLRQCYRNKDGKRHAYWALVESYRTVRGPRQRVVAWLGELDEHGRLAIRHRERRHTCWEQCGQRNSCFLPQHLLLGPILRSTLFVFLRESGFGERDSDGLLCIHACSLMHTISFWMRIRAREDDGGKLSSWRLPALSA